MRNSLILRKCSSCLWNVLYLVALAVPRDVLKRSGSCLQPCVPAWRTQRLVETLPWWLDLFTPRSWERMGRFQDHRSCRAWGPSCWLCRVRSLEGKAGTAAPTRPWGHEVSCPESWCLPAETGQLSPNQGRSHTAPGICLEHRDNWIRWGRTGASSGKSSSSTVCARFLRVF